MPSSTQQGRVLRDTRLCNAQIGLSSRRDFLTRSGLGIGGLSLAYLLQSPSQLLASDHPLAPKAPHFVPKAKRVIHIFLSGGQSHLDLFYP